MVKPLKLPHPELVELSRACKQQVFAVRIANVSGVAFSYSVFDLDGVTLESSPWPASELTALYDESGIVLIAQSFLDNDQRKADLIAWHEHVEVETKRRGLPHHRAHRRALVEELLAARRVFVDSNDLLSYVKWRVRGYPPSKVPDSDTLAAILFEELDRERPRKGRLMDIILPHLL